MYKNSATPLFRAQSLEGWFLWAHRHNKPELSNSECGAWFLEYWFLQHFWRPQRDSNHAGPLSCHTGGLAVLGQRNPERNKEACHLMVFPVLFQISILTLRTAETQLNSLEGRTNPPGMATGSGEAPGQSPVRSYSNWETHHLRGAPGKGTTVKETWVLGRKEALW